jgi:hypothetical protein
MKTYLTLSDDGPPFFFLGDPDKLTLSLTFQQPGPTEVDFSRLAIPDQKKVLAHLLAEQIESTVSYKELFSEYQNIFSQSAPTEPEPQKPAKGPAEKPVGADQSLTIPKTYLDKEAKFQAKCEKLVKKGIKVIKAELKKASNVRMLRTIRDLELKKKSPRVSVINFIELELRKMDRAIIESIEKDANPVTIDTESPPKGGTFVSDVIESEQETVQLTPETLIDQETQ